jgi:hypothetical protein
MPLGLLVVGLMLLVTAMRGTTSALGAQLKKDLIGDGQNSGFIVWVVILAILGVIGSVSSSYGRKDVQHMTQLFIVLVIVALVLKQQNLVQSFIKQISSAPVSPAADTATQTAPATSNTSGKSSSNSPIPNVSTSDLESAAMYAVMA